MLSVWASNVFFKGFCGKGLFVQMAPLQIQNSIQIRKVKDLILKSRKRGNTSTFQNCCLFHFYTNELEIPVINILVYY